MEMLLQLEGDLRVPPIPAPAATRLHSYIVNGKGIRTFGDQHGIWSQKFDFTYPPFDRISSSARDLFDYTLPSGAPASFLDDPAGAKTTAPHHPKWEPSWPSHQLAWLGSRRGPGSLALPADLGPLSPEQRAQEILEASSGPGISRHHWYGDVDLFSVEGADFESGGRYEAHYGWLSTHARDFGFYQTYTATSGGHGQGYFEERWHWSYYPVGAAVLEVASDAATLADLRTRIDRIWNDHSVRLGGASWLLDTASDTGDTNWEGYVFHNLDRAGPW
jgi:hypothetical protein